jgi:hypothetical protein
MRILTVGNVVDKHEPVLLNDPDANRSETALFKMFITASARSLEKGDRRYVIILSELVGGQ